MLQQMMLQHLITKSFTTSTYLSLMAMINFMLIAGWFQATEQNEIHEN